MCLSIIKDKLKKLDELVEKYPTKVPVQEVADFLDINLTGLRSALARNNTPFGFAYQKEDGGYRVMVIPTVTFYLWFTNTRAQMVFKGDVQNDN